MSDPSFNDIASRWSACFTRIPQTKTQKRYMHGEALHPGTTRLMYTVCNTACVMPDAMQLTVEKAWTVGRT